MPLPFNISNDVSTAVERWRNGEFRCVLFYWHKDDLVEAHGDSLCLQEGQDGGAMHSLHSEDVLPPLLNITSLVRRMNAGVSDIANKDTVNKWHPEQGENALPLPLDIVSQGA